MPSHYSWNFHFPKICPIIIKQVFSGIRKNAIACKNIVNLLNAPYICRIAASTLVTCDAPFFFCEKSKTADYRGNTFNFIDRINFCFLQLINSRSCINNSQAKMTAIILIRILNIFGAGSISFFFKKLVIPLRNAPLFHQNIGIIGELRFP